MSGTEQKSEAASSQAPICVRDATAGDEARWRVLWAGYTAFYETDVPADVTAHTWARILDPASPISCRLAEREGSVAGFAVSVLHPGTWGHGPRCYLEDLFVDPKVRGGGVGRALIQDLITRGRAEGWIELYWQTKASNTVARRLYDSFTPADEFVRYCVQLA